MQKIFAIRAVAGLAGGTSRGSLVASHSVGSASYLAESDQVSLRTLAAFGIISTLITSAFVPPDIPGGESSSDVSERVHDG